MAANVTTGFCNKCSCKSNEQTNFLSNKLINIMNVKHLIDIYQMSTGNTAEPNREKFLKEWYYSRRLSSCESKLMISYVWIMSITTIPKANDDCSPLTGWPFHDKPPMQPRNISIAVPINSAKKIANTSTVFLPMVFAFFCQFARFCKMCRSVSLEIEIFEIDWAKLKPEQPIWFDL